MSNCAGSEPYALQVLGNSMEPEFPNGCIVIVEPGGALLDGCYVIANHANDDVILRQLRLLNDSWVLTPLNPAYDDQKINGIADIKGTVIQRAGRRRADRKSYI